MKSRQADFLKKIPVPIRPAGFTPKMLDDFLQRAVIFYVQPYSTFSNVLVRSVISYVRSFYVHLSTSCDCSANLLKFRSVIAQQTRLIVTGSNSVSLLRTINFSLPERKLVFPYGFIFVQRCKMSVQKPYSCHLPPPRLIRLYLILTHLFPFFPFCIHFSL